MIMNHMVELHATAAASRLDAIFGALADPTRRAMVTALAGGQRTIGELAAPFAMSFAGVSKHIRVLEAAGLLHRRVDGRRHVCAIAPEPLAAADAWLDDYVRLWTERFDRIDVLLAEQAATDDHNHATEEGDDQ